MSTSKASTIITDIFNPDFPENFSSVVDEYSGSDRKIIRAKYAERLQRTKESSSNCTNHESGKVGTLRNRLKKLNDSVITKATQAQIEKFNSGSTKSEIKAHVISELKKYIREELEVLKTHLRSYVSQDLEKQLSLGLTEAGIKNSKIPRKETELIRKLKSDHIDKVTENLIQSLRSSDSQDEKSLQVLGKSIMRDLDATWVSQFAGTKGSVNARKQRKWKLEKKKINIKFNYRIASLKKEQAEFQSMREKVSIKLEIAETRKCPLDPVC